MLRFIVRIERQARTKNGAAPQTTTGVASASSTQGNQRAPAITSSGWPGRCPPIVTTRSGAASTTLTQKRRVMLTSSGFSGSGPATGATGSSAMPQIGQSPGPSFTISGCIGQVYFAPAGAGASCGAGFK